jgi:hypothetical protein
VWSTTPKQQRIRIPAPALSSPPILSPATARGSKAVHEPERVPRRRLRMRKREFRRRSSDTSSYGDISALGHRETSENGFDSYGEDREYVDGEFGDQNISVTTIKADNGHRMGRIREESELERGAGGNETGNRKRKVEGPMSGQAYRMIDRRIIEDTPERTVTISTWREEVARRASDAMSVYYVNPDDYAMADGETSVTATRAAPNQARRHRDEGHSSSRSREGREVRDKKSFRNEQQWSRVSDFFFENEDILTGMDKPLGKTVTASFNSTLLFKR